MNEINIPRAEDTKRLEEDKANNELIEQRRDVSRAYNSPEYKQAMNALRQKQKAQAKKQKKRSQRGW